MLEREELGIVELTIPVRVRAFGLGDSAAVSFNKDFVRVLDARAAETDDGSCRACFTASISLDLVGLRRGRGEFNLGGRGGGGNIGVVEWPSKPGRRGGGGRGPAVE